MSRGARFVGPAFAVALTLAITAGGALAQTTDRAEPTRPPERPAAMAPEAQSSPKPQPKPDLAPDQQPESSEPAPARDDEPETEPTPAVQPAPPPLRESDFAFSACLLALHDLGARYRVLDPITEPDQPACGITRPVEIDQILPGIALAGSPAMRCDTARALGFWMRDFVRPAAARLPGAPRLSGLQLGTGYDCRGRVGGDQRGKLSEHALGNAIDVAAFTFHDAEPIPVTPREDTGDLVEAFQRAVRGAACLYFTTVLGPGSNAAHDDHLHLDIAARRGDWQLCQ